jgi:bifunctional non-homologous end joining protein LigD
MMALRDGERVRVLSRNGLDWSDRLPSVLAAVTSLKVKSCLIDGEVAVCDERGLAVFKLLRRGGRIKREAMLFAFDLLDLRSRPLEERKRALGELLWAAKPSLQLVEHLAIDGPTVYAHACALGAEGIVSKRLGSRYRPGPNKSPDWIKVKNPQSPAVKREARRSGASDDEEEDGRALGSHGRRQAADL